MKRLFCLVWLVSSYGFAQTGPEPQLASLIDKYQAVGLFVAVVSDGELVYTKSFGKKNLETGEPLQTNNLFRIASISKSFSSTSIMQLVDAGKLSLNDDVSDLMGFKIRNPKYPDRRITLKMLLSHTSSINDSQGYYTLDPLDSAKNPNWEKCFNEYAPGAGYQYCNLNFNLVGTVIEKYSGERFDQYVRNHVLAPLGLYGGYNVDSLDNTKFASLYAYNAEYKRYELSEGAYHPRREIISNYEMGYTTPVFSPTGGMKISGVDLAKYMIMHMNYGKLGDTRIMKKKLSKVMQKPVSKNGYGLALRYSNKLISGEEMIGHTGSAYGLYSSMFFEPKKKFGIVAITNGCADCISEDWENLMLPEVTRVLYHEYID